MLLMQYIAWAWRTTKSKRRKRRGIGSPPMEGLERGSAISGNGNDEGLERGSAISGNGNGNDEHQKTQNFPIGG